MLDTGFSTIASALTCQCVKSRLPVAIEFAAQSGKRWVADSPVGKTDFFSGQLLEKPVGQFRLNLAVNDRAEKIAPEYGPLFLLFVQAHGSFFSCGGKLISAKGAARCQLGEN